MLTKCVGSIEPFLEIYQGDYHEKLHVYLHRIYHIEYMTTSCWHTSVSYVTHHY